MRQAGFVDSRPGGVVGVDGDVDCILYVQHAGRFGVDLVVGGEQGGADGGGGHGVAFGGRAV